MQELDQYETLLRPVNDSEFRKAQENLSKNMKQQSFYREQQFVIFESQTISSDFTGENLRRSYYKNSKIQEANLTNVGFSGSVFVSTDFIDCVINNTKLDFCEFDDCKFTAAKNNEMIHLNFNNSTICNSQFSNLNMDAANFTNAIFEDVTFEHCEWKSLCLEGTVFRNTLLDDVKLKKLNFEFSYFDNMKLNNVRLPFPTIPYIFNGLTYLMSTHDSISISSAASESGSISVDEYLGYMHDLIIFYTKTQNYFPLANIYIAQNKYDQAYAAIMTGIKVTMLHLRNFRLVYYYCKLLHLTKEFMPSQRARAYNLIIKYSAQNNWRPIDYYNFSQYIDRIRNILLNEQQGDFLALTLSTNILCTEYGKISCLYQTIEELIRLIEKDRKKRIVHYIEIRHNSPHEFFLKVFSNPDELSVLLDAIKIALLGIGKIIDWKKEKKNKKRANELKIIENELKSEQLNYYKLQNEQLILQNKILREQLNSLNKNVCNQNIMINNINYYVSNSNA